MDRRPQTKAEADADLEQLRADRGVGRDVHGSEVLKNSLDEALKILSDQLYKTSTRFLLELVQNADDNTYADGVDPLLHLALSSPGESPYVVTSCNEVGFSFGQLNALSQVGKSTKKAITDGQKGYIGEKGIGFKSVFKVADVIQVASGHYEFKYDRNQLIGMILPISAPFPQSSRSAEHTQVMLHLTSQGHYNDIMREMQHMEPQILLFLRKLRCLKVTTGLSSSLYRYSHKDSDPAFGQAKTATLLTETNSQRSSLKYVVYEHTVQGMPAEPRREGVSTSEVVIALPVTENGTAVVSNQKTFAFLPVDNFGFKFLIQADFLLVASRESLDYSLPWNKTLRDGISDTFVKAVSRMALMPECEPGKGLCYEWPKYLPRARTGAAFWNKLHDTIIKKLTSMDILLSQNGSRNLYFPKKLRYIPTTFRLDGKRLFTDCSEEHLSFNYDHVHPQLKTLGVSDMDIDDLCSELEMFFGIHGKAGLQSKSQQWHRRISSLFRNQWGLLSRLKKLPLVPLRDGTWVSSETAQVYLPSANVSVHVPSGVSISIVDKAVSQDAERRPFLEFLGLEEYDPSQVCSLIIGLYDRDSSDMAWRSDDDLVSDLAYLYLHKNHLASCCWAPPAGMCYITQLNGKRQRKRSGIYCLDSSLRNNLVAKYMNTKGSPFAMLDDAYETTLALSEEQSKQDFVHWLKRSASFSLRPIIWDDGPTAEWHFLRKTNVMDLLKTVRDGDDYAGMGPLMKAEVSQLIVPCHNGHDDGVLSSMALPTPELVSCCPHIPYINMSDENLHEWTFLSKFEVITAPSTTARLRELEALSSLNITNTKSQVYDLYRALAQNANNLTEIRTAFKTNPLVLISQPNPRWVYSRDCVWSAPAQLHNVTRLSRRYKDCKALFCSWLGVDDAQLHHVVDAFCSFVWPEKDPEAEFVAIFKMLCTYSKTGSALTKDQIERIRRAPVFPVRRALAAVSSASSIAAQDWFIGDKFTLKEAFSGKVNLLYMSLKDVASLKAIFEVLGCQTQYLSDQVEQKVSYASPMIRDLLQEYHLKERLGYICRLSEGNISLKDLGEIRVWSVGSISVTRNLGGVVGTPGSELVSIDEKDNITNIYMCHGGGPSCQFHTNFEVLQHFAESLVISGDDQNLANLIMNAPIEELPVLLRKHDRTFDEGEDKDNRNSDGNHDQAADDDQDNDEDSDEQDGGASGVTANERIMPENSLRNLIPAYQSQMEDISRLAGSFQMSCSVVKEPAALKPGLALSLPVRFRASSRKGTRGRIGSQDQSIFSSTVSSNGRTLEKTGSIFSTSPRPSTPSGTSYRGALSIFTPPSTVGSARGSPPRLSDVPQSVIEIRRHEIGSKGEYFIHCLLEGQIPDWTCENWTSRLRYEAGHPQFTENERDYADFTYKDTSGHMKKLLLESKMTVLDTWTESTTYHLEVKSTEANQDETFYVSQNQVDKMRQFDGDPNNAYILIRVSNIASPSPGLVFYPEPWKLYLEGTLDFRSEGGYCVETKSNDFLF